MKKLTLLLLLCFLTTQFVSGQNKKIYVSRHGGTKKLLTFGKIGYNNYHFRNNADQCDSLICSGSGFELCKIDKEIIRMTGESGKYYALFNKAIRQTEKRVRKSNKENGQFYILVNNQVVSVKYYNADKKGNADINIEIVLS